jgi:hypothetical protein
MERSMRCAPVAIGVALSACIPTSLVSTDDRAPLAGNAGGASASNWPAPAMASPQGPPVVTVVGATVVGGIPMGDLVVGGTVVGGTSVGAGGVTGGTVVGGIAIGGVDVGGGTVVGATVVGGTLVGAQGP